MKKSTKESGFSVFGMIITIALLLILIGAGYFAYNLVKDNAQKLKDKKAGLTTDEAKNMINGEVDKTKQDINAAVNNAVNNATNSAVDSAKNQIDNSLNNLKK